MLNTAVASSPIWGLQVSDAAVRVKLCRGIIVIAGAQMYIAADSILLHPYHQGNLAVGL